jgi:hypothetical protein
LFFCKRKEENENMELDRKRLMEEEDGGGKRLKLEAIPIDEPRGRKEKLVGERSVESLESQLQRIVEGREDDEEDESIEDILLSCVDVPINPCRAQIKIPEYRVLNQLFKTPKIAFSTRTLAEFCKLPATSPSKLNICAVEYIHQFFIKVNNGAMKWDPTRKCCVFLKAKEVKELLCQQKAFEYLWKEC